MFYTQTLNVTLLLHDNIICGRFNKQCIVYELSNVIAIDNKFIYKKTIFFT